MRNLRDNYRKNKQSYGGDNAYQQKKDIDELIEDISSLSARVSALETDVADMKPLVNATVTFDSDGGSSVASQTVPFNTVATEPDDPTKEGYDFVGWFRGEETTEFDFATKIRANTTLKAHWSAEESE